MDKLKYLIAKYPNRIKYGLIAIDTIFIFMTIKIFINYNNIEQAIIQTALEAQKKTDEFGFTQNFQIPYEKSEYAQRFLKHENNMLLPGEFIIKLEEKTYTSTTGTNSTPDEEKTIKILNNPEDARHQFFKEKLFPPEKVTIK